MICTSMLAESQNCVLNRHFSILLPLHHFQFLSLCSSSLRLSNFCFSRARTNYWVWWGVTSSTLPSLSLCTYMQSHTTQLEWKCPSHPLVTCKKERSWFCSMRTISRLPITISQLLYILCSVWYRCWASFGTLNPLRVPAQTGRREEKMH